MKALITGGSGFFGLYLAKGLMAKGYEVRVIDTQDLRAADIEKEVEFIKADIRDNDALEKAVKGVDFVFHNAAVLPISRTTRKNFWETNVGGTRSVLAASARNKIKKVIFISSSAPYGIPARIPIDETAPFNPVCNYGRSKIAAEKVCKEFRTQDLNVIILRPRTIVGKGRLGIFQIFYSWIADQKNLYIIGKGDNPFQLLSAGDLVAACILSIEKECRNEDFNLGTDRFSTVKNDLLELIAYAKSRSKIISVPASLAKSVLRTLDILNLSPFTPWHYLTSDKPFYFDINKAEKLLGWKPLDSNKDMFRESYEWYIQHRKEAESEYGITHRKAVKQKLLRILRGL